MKITRLLLITSILIIITQLVLFPPGHQFYRFLFIPGKIEGHGNEIIVVTNGLDVPGKMTCSSGALSVTSYTEWGDITGNEFTYHLADNAYYEAEWQVMPMHHYYDIRCDGDWSFSVKSHRFPYKVGVF